MPQPTGGMPSATLAARDDSALPALHYLLHPRSATRLLRDAWEHSATSGPAPTVQTVRIMRYHRGKRCTLWLEFDAPQSSGCFAKVYAHGDDAIARTLRAVAQAGSSEATPYRISTLVAADPQLHVLLLQKVPGRPIQHYPAAQLPEAAARAAEWLGRFHGSNLPLPATFRLHDPMASATRWYRSMRGETSACTPGLAESAAHVLAALSAARRPWPPSVRLLHGDFGVAHVYLSPDLTSVIDWDSARPGDPAEDAGRFVASLYHLAACRQAPEHLALDVVTRFQVAYAQTQPTIAQAVPFYTAWACLHKASRLVMRASPRQERAAALLEFALASLSGAPRR